MDGVLGRYVFPSAIGWMAFEWGPHGLRRLVFGHARQEMAARALSPTRSSWTGSTDEHPLIHRLQEYAEGEFDDFLDVDVDHFGRTPFATRVLEACRLIPPGRTLCYGDLASRVRSPRAARAVGQVMATNRVPIVVPCHRVVAACGRLGGFSAPGGLATKERLLRQEARWQTPLTIFEHSREPAEW
jgi:methylated-DNA-[protein]-cysteine S-methyltransferase